MEVIMMQPNTHLNVYVYVMTPTVIYVAWKCLHNDLCHINTPYDSMCQISLWTAGTKAAVNLTSWYKNKDSEDTNYKIQQY